MRTLAVRIPVLLKYRKRVHQVRTCVARFECGSRELKSMHITTYRTRVLRGFFLILRPQQHTVRLTPFGDNFMRQKTEENAERGTGQSRRSRRRQDEVSIRVYKEVFKKTRKNK